MPSSKIVGWIIWYAGPGFQGAIAPGRLYVTESYARGALQRMGLGAPYEIRPVILQPSEE